MSVTSCVRDVYFVFTLPVHDRPRSSISFQAPQTASNGILLSLLFFIYLLAVYCKHIYNVNNNKCFETAAISSVDDGSALLDTLEFLLKPVRTEDDFLKRMISYLESIFTIS